MKIVWIVYSFRINVYKIDLYYEVWSSKYEMENRLP